MTIRDCWLSLIFMTTAVGSGWAVSADAQSNQKMPETGTFRSLDGLIVIDEAYIASNAEDGYRKAVVDIWNVGKDAELLMKIVCGGSKIAYLHKKDFKGNEAIMLSELQPARISGGMHLDLNPQFVYPWGGFSDPGYIAVPDDAKKKDIKCNLYFKRSGAVEISFKEIARFNQLHRF